MHSPLFFSGTLHWKTPLRCHFPQVLLVWGILLSAATAADGTWQGTGNSPLGWGTAANWTGGVIGGGAAGNTVNLSATQSAAKTISLNGNRLLGTLNLSPSSSFAYTLAPGTAGSVTFDNGAGTAALNFTGTGLANHAISAPILLSSNLEISSPLARQHLLSGIISGTGRSIAIDSNGVNAASTVSVIGDVAFSGQNTYSGGTTVTDAHLQANNAQALGTGPVVVNGFATVDLIGGSTIANNFTLTGPGWLTGTSRQGALKVRGTTVLSGTVTAQPTASHPVTGIFTDSSSSVQYTGNFAGTGPLEFTGGNFSSIAILNNTSPITHAGPWIINRTVQLGNNNTNGYLAGNEITTNGTLQFRRTDHFVFSNPITGGTGGITQAGTGEITLPNPAYGYMGSTTVNGFHSKMLFNPGGNGGPLALSARNVRLSNTADLEFRHSNEVEISSLNGGTDAWLIQSGTGTLLLNNTTQSGTAQNNTGGRVIVNSGKVVLAKGSRNGVQEPGFAEIHALDAGNDTAAIVNGGTLQLAGTGFDQIYDPGVVRMNGGTFDLNGRTETVAFLSGAGGTVTNTSNAPAFLTLGFQNPGERFPLHFADGQLFLPEYSGTIADGSGPVSLALRTNQILSGVNTFTGDITTPGGLLIVNGSTHPNGQLVAPNLAGTGSVGHISSAPTGCVISPGATNSTGDPPVTFTCESLAAVNDLLTLVLDITESGNDKVVVHNTATFSSDVNAILVLPHYRTLPVSSASNLVLLEAGNLIGSTPILRYNPFSPPDSAHGTRNYFALIKSGNKLELAVRNGPSGTAQICHWAAPGTSGRWDVSIEINPVWTSTDGEYFELDSVVFGGAAANTVVTIPGNVFPSRITDESSGGGYTFVLGPFNDRAIDGSGDLLKTGPSMLSMNCPNTFYRGQVKITGGTFVTGHAEALGVTTGQTYVSNGGTLDISGQNLGAEIINIAGPGVGGQGALVNNGAAQTSALRYVRLTGNATVGGSGGWNIASYLDLAGFTLTKEGAGQLTLSQDVTAGNLIVNTGAVRLNRATLTDRSTVSISATGILNLSYSGTMRVSALTLAGVTQAAGIYSSTNTAGRLTGAGLIQVVAPAAPASTYSTWAAGFTFPVLSDTAASADPDGDGLQNLTEYALGLDPRVPSPSPGLFQNGLLSFTKGTAAATNNSLLYQVEISTSLSGDWSPVTPASNTAAGISYLIPPGTIRQFARLKITLGP